VGKPFCWDETGVLMEPSSCNADFTGRNGKEGFSLTVIEASPNIPKIFSFQVCISLFCVAITKIPESRYFIKERGLLSS
jgi:hypothetical protein